MRRHLHRIAMLLAFVFMFSVLAGCQSGGGSTATEAPAATQAAPEETAAVSDAGEEETEPTAGPAFGSASIADLSSYGDELSIWIATLMSIENNTESVNELTAIQEYEEKTGVYVNWEQASSAGAVEQFNVMMASGDYPDIILSFDTYMNGGATAGYEQDIIIKLNDFIEEYMPNYYSYIQGDAALLRDVVTDEGDYLGVYGFYDNEYYPLSGPMVRSDWLEALSLDVPVTYSDYEEVALAFKTEYGCSDPILMLGDCTFFSGQGYMVGYFSGGLGTPAFSSVGTGSAAVALYQEDGVVKSSLLEEGYRAYIEMLRDWYAQGIISADFSSNPTSQMTSDYSSFIFNSDTGIFVGDAVNMTGYAASAVDESFALVGAPDPVVAEGDAPNPFGIDRSRQQGSGAAITTNCEHVELAMRWLDQWFTDEGIILANYGVENLAHTVGEDGVRRYTDLILYNETLSQQATTVLYTVTFVPTVNTQDTRFVLWEDTPVVTEAVSLWYDSTTGEGNLPNISLNTEESDTYSNLAATIQTYAAENVARFVVGERDMSEWDAFGAQIQELGIQACIDAYQAALDRYNAR